MAKRQQKKEAQESHQGEALTNAKEQMFEIRSATIEDDFCHFGYNIKFPGGSDEIPKRKGHGIIDPDMHKAFEKLNVHMAFKDDIFKHAGLEVENIEDMDGTELSELYTVSGFKISGKDENESVVLVGTKYLSSGGRMSINTPKLDLHSASYKWYNELKDAIDKCRSEVLQYMNGKYTEVAKEELIEKNPNQLEIPVEEESAAHNFEAAEI